MFYYFSTKIIVTDILSLSYKPIYVNSLVLMESLTDCKYINMLSVKINYNLEQMHSGM